MGFIRRWILSLVLREIEENGFEVGGYSVEIVDGAFTIHKK